MFHKLFIKKTSIQLLSLKNLALITNKNANPVKVLAAVPTNRALTVARLKPKTRAAVQQRM